LRPVYVIFCDERKEREFLGSDKRQEIEKMIDRLKRDPIQGIRIQKSRWPRQYVIRHRITNLWKLDLRKGWRLVYTLKSDDEQLFCVILEWFNHKDYERRFQY
jgi:hypothetical protein